MEVVLISVILGILVGATFSLLIVLTMVFFRSGIERRVNVIEKQIAIKGPRPKGYIFEPQEEGEAMRQEIIAKNNRAGKDTKVSDLR